MQTAHLLRRAAPTAADGAGEFMLAPESSGLGVEPVIGSAPA